MKIIAVFLLMILVSCASPSPNPVDAPAAPAVAGDPPAGRWSGDYGPDADRRERISVELRWEGSDLRGVVQPGMRDLEIVKASFKPETRAITMEFDAQGNNGQTIHYIIEGKVEGNTMSGSWHHDDQVGDFRVSRE